MTDALRARGVTVELGGRRVLDDVSFDVARGEFACLCGPNGGGKTTFLKAALGFVPLAAGQIEVLGARPGTSGNAVGYLPQSKAFNPTFPARVVDVIVANRRGAWPVRVSPADREAARAAGVPLHQVGAARAVALSGAELGGGVVADMAFLRSESSVDDTPRPCGGGVSRRC